MMFYFSALAALAARPVMTRGHADSFRKPNAEVWIFVGMVLTIVIGFRYEVGADWFNYLRHYERMQYEGWDYALAQNEFGHWFMNKTMSVLGWGMTGVNVVYGAIFSLGLVLFLQTLPRPWLALATAVPYLIIVVSMGYSRQAVALGFVFVGLVALSRGRFIAFGLWILAGSAFHNSAVVLIPFAGLTAGRYRIRIIAIVAILIVAGYESFLSNTINRFVDVYVEQKLTDSQGALIRLSMNAIAAIAFLRYRRIFNLSASERSLWTIVALLAITMFLAYFVTGLSTALDRIALYFIPLQLVTFAHLPDAFKGRGGRDTEGVILVLGYFAVVQFVWLNFATHAPYWLPYQMGIVD